MKEIKSRMETVHRISAKPVSAEEYKNLGCPLYRKVHEEGVEI